jgi:hypothetical protein
MRRISMHNKMVVRSICELLDLNARDVFHERARVQYNGITHRIESSSSRGIFRQNPWGFVKFFLFLKHF